MSYDDSVKRQAFDMYVEELEKGTKAHKILPKIAKSMEIPYFTLRDWRQEGDWSHRAKVEVLFSQKMALSAIPEKLVAMMTPDNAADIGRIWLDAVENAQPVINKSDEPDDEPKGSFFDEAIKNLDAKSGE